MVSNSTPLITKYHELVQHLGTQLLQVYDGLLGQQIPNSTTMNKSMSAVSVSQVTATQSEQQQTHHPTTDTPFSDTPIHLKHIIHHHHISLFLLIIVSYPF